MTDRDVLVRFRDVVGAGTVRGPFQRGPDYYRPIYVWTCSRWADIERIVREFRPHLLERRQAMADLMLDSAPRDKKKTHCKRGHPLRSPDADVRITDGYPVCRRCAMARYFEKRSMLPARPPHRPVCRRGHLMEGADARTWFDKRGRRQCTPCVRIRRLELVAVRRGTASKLPNTRALKGWWGIAEPEAPYLIPPPSRTHAGTLSVTAWYQPASAIEKDTRMGESPSARVPYKAPMDGKLGHAISDGASPMRETVWS